MWHTAMYKKKKLEHLMQFAMTLIYSICNIEITSNYTKVQNKDCMKPILNAVTNKWRDIHI